MRDLLPAVERWQQEGKSVALATVVTVYGSAPRPLGSKMAVSSGGDMLGSVSGGCVEGAVFREAQEAMQTGRPRLVQYGIADELAFEVVGLACGGNIEVFIEPGPPEPALLEAVRAGRLVAQATALDGPAAGRRLLVWPDGASAGDLGSDALNRAALQTARRQLASQRPQRVTLSAQGETLDVFVDVFPPPPKLVIVGAVHIAMPLVTFGNELGFHTVVVDARAAFATPERFPHAGELIVRWPADALAEMTLDEATCVVFLSHDEKLDNPALAVALKSRARYIGALGAKTTHRRRLKALREMGFDEETLARIHSPVGLQLGAERPAEIALAIIAEIVAEAKRQAAW